MANKQPEAALAVITDNDYLALTLDTSELKDSLKESLGGEGFGPNDFDTLTVPSGTGSPVWNLPDAETPPKELTGIIIHHMLNRVMWLTPLDEGTGNMPPDCSGKMNSDGLMVGSQTRSWIAQAFNENTHVKKPTGDVAIPAGAGAGQKQTCDDCPFAAWKTAKKGNGQYCNMKRNVFLLLPDKPFPIVVRVPATSLKGSKKYLQSLFKKLLAPSKVETSLTLHKEAGPPAYYVIDFNQSNTLSPEAAKKASAYSQAMRPFIDKVEAVLTESSQAAAFTFEEDEEEEEY